MPVSKKEPSTCFVEHTLRVLEGRWKVLALYHLCDGTKRFNQLQRLLPGIAPRTLAKQLREMQHDGLVHRKVFAEIPPRVEYSLTPLGKSLKPLLDSMDLWGQTLARRNRTTGTASAKNS